MSAGSPQETPLRVLVVDGNRSFLGRVQLAFEAAGLEARTAASEDEAIALVTEGDLDLLVISFEPEHGPQAIVLAYRRSHCELAPVLVLYPKGTDTIDVDSETARLEASGALVRPVKIAALVTTARGYALASHLSRRLVEREEELESVNAARRIDPASGFYRFDQFKARLAAEVKRARRYRYPFALLLISMDSLDDIEQRHDSETRRTLLGGLSLAIARCLRDLDLPVSYGPGRYLAVLPHTPRRGARAVGERIRRRVLRTRMTLSDGTLGTTTSIGLASYDGKGEVSFAALAAEANQALAIAQGAGGNRVAEVPTGRRVRAG